MGGQHRPITSYAFVSRGGGGGDGVELSRRPGERCRRWPVVLRAHWGPGGDPNARARPQPWPGGYVFFQTPVNRSLRGAQLLSAFACNVSVFADALQVYRPLVGHTGTDPIVRWLPAAATVAVKSGCPAHFLVPGV